MKLKKPREKLFQFIPEMWWGARLERVPRFSDTHTAGEGTTFVVPLSDIEQIEYDLTLLSHMDGAVPGRRGHQLIKRTLALEDVKEYPALPLVSEDPLDKLLTIGMVPRNDSEQYWSAETQFWSKWRSDEEKARSNYLESVKSKLAASQREAAIKAAKADQDRLIEERREADSRKKAEEDKQRAASHPMQAVSSPLPSPPETDFERILSEGKQFRSEFIQVWRDISLAISTTAANARSIQQNGLKLISALNRSVAQAGPSRPHVVTWLCTFCGSKLGSQATSGNKALVWSFAYLARIVSEKFPETVTLGLLGELKKSGQLAMAGTPNISVKSELSGEDAKNHETQTRMWVALMCVFGDESALWGWSVHAINSLRMRRPLLPSGHALWNMMKVFILMDVGLYDLRRIFGNQAMWLVDILEKSVFPSLDSELQAVSQPNSISVQFRYYLDACYNVLQSRKYLTPPEGQVLAAAKESELNPDL